MKITGRYALIEQLLKDGINMIFGNPGSTESGLIDALNQYPAMNYILGLHETSVIGMADAYARATRKPTIAQIHAPAGLGNSIGMIYQANRGYSPLIIIAGSAGIKYEHMDGLLAGNQVEMAKPVTKWAVQVSSITSLLRIIRRAVKIVTTPPVKPVFIELPMDILDQEYNGEIIQSPRLVISNTPDNNNLEKISNYLLEAENPCIIMGDNIAIDNAQEELSEVASILGAAVWGAFNHEVNISYCNFQYQGVLGWNNGNQSINKLKNYDTVLITGTTDTPALFPATSTIFPENCKVIHLDNDPHQIGKNYPIEIGMVCNLKTALKGLANTIIKLKTGEQESKIRKRLEVLKKNHQINIETEIEKDRKQSQESPLHPSVFFEKLSQKITTDTIIFDEAITTSSYVTRYLPRSQPGTYYLLRGGVLGAGVSGTAGIALANPGKTVIGFIGDGASMFSIHTLWTAAHYRLNTKFVICNDRSYRILKINMKKYWQQNQIPFHPFPASFNLDNPDIDFVKLSESFGVPAIRINKANEISAGIENMLDKTGPFLIELLIREELDNSTEIITSCQ